MAIVADLSGSMRYDSLTGVDHSGTREGGNNPDDLIPSFGHYASGSASMRRTTPYSSSYALSNFTKAMTENDNRTPMINDYYSHVRTPNTPNDEVPAWSSAGAGDSEGFVTGDKPVKRLSNSSLYAQHVAHVRGLSTGQGPDHAKDTTWETLPTSSSGGYGSSFAGYTRPGVLWQDLLHLAARSARRGSHSHRL